MGVRRVRVVGVFSVRAQWSITFAISSWVLLSNSVYIIAKRTLELHLIRHYLEAYLVKCRVLQNKTSRFFNVLGIVAFCTIATILRERETSTGPFLFITTSCRDDRTMAMRSLSLSTGTSHHSLGYGLLVCSCQLLAGKMDLREDVRYVVSRYLYANK
jgi:hypothetical protein